MSNAAWDAFGSDSDESDDEVDGHGAGPSDSPFKAAVDSAVLAITQHFASAHKITGVALRERVVGVAANDADSLAEMAEARIRERGMKVVGSTTRCDAAIVCPIDSSDEDWGRTSNIRRSLLPGGFLFLLHHVGITSQQLTARLSDSTWDVNVATVNEFDGVSVTRVQKRACTINSFSCPWMDKVDKIPRQLMSRRSSNEEGFEPLDGESFLQYERRITGELTISPSASECASGFEGSAVLSDTNLRRAVSILQRHGLVIVKGLLAPEQTLKWGRAVLSDFEAAAQRLKSHPTRPVDLLNPNRSGEGATFEPLSYMEMSMREDLRVDLRHGPAIRELRELDNRLAYDSMANQSKPSEKSANNGPAIINSQVEGTLESWRFHPSIIAIIKALFNPSTASLAKGNFGRWNFGGSGPDGTPQPFRLGQIGSVVSCPGSGDQAIHADTPHLFETINCHPCHYLNVFTPGYTVEDNQDGIQNGFDNDGIFTGDSSMGGTALVHGSHKLSVTAELLGDDESSAGSDKELQRQLLQLRTLRPALSPGDILIFDNRTLHYGLANTSQGTGHDRNAGRRPLLYLNVSQAWFHDPKNWDDRERVFSIEKPEKARKE